MKKVLFVLSVPGLTISTHAQTATPATGQTTETIVCIRHGEKTARRPGTAYLPRTKLRPGAAGKPLKKFGAPQFIFAPNPEHKVDGNPGYDYGRPVMTIEPTAIRCGLPVNTEFGYDEIKGLEDELDKPQYQNAIVFVAWEHGLLDRFAENMVRDNGGNTKEVLPWTNKEYDMIFIFKIVRENGQKKFSFTVDHEGLNGLKDTCPLNLWAKMFSR